MIKKRLKTLAAVSIATILVVVLLGPDLLSQKFKDLTYRIVTIGKISKFNQDRMAFQHIEAGYDDDAPFSIYDNSVASLLVIKDRKMYLFKDGYDSSYEVITQKRILEMENRMIPDLWENKVDGLPDYVTITDRRLKILQKEIRQDKKEEGKKAEPKNLTKDYIDIYSEVRDKFIKTHVKIMKSMMIGDKENTYVVRKALPKKIFETGETKFFTAIAAKTRGELLYYAEDADGDGITETFTVEVSDGFTWGAKSGPNIVFIYKCNYVDADNKPINASIKEAIGSLAREAYFGTDEEEKNLTKALQKEKEELKEMIDNIYLFDSRRYMKK
ncbi:MAG: hypothetical protein GY754_04645 [bacterium]|nr:hypothetical protein [bacterium]